MIQGLEDEDKAIVMELSNSIKMALGDHMKIYNSVMDGNSGLPKNLDEEVQTVFDSGKQSVAFCDAYISKKLKYSDLKAKLNTVVNGMEANLRKKKSLTQTGPTSNLQVIRELPQTENHQEDSRAARDKQSTQKVSQDFKQALINGGEDEDDFGLQGNAALGDNFNYDFDTIQGGKKGEKVSKPWRQRKKSSSEEEEEEEVDMQGAEAQKRINAGFTGFGKILEDSGDEEEKKMEDSSRSRISKSQTEKSGQKDKNFLTEKEKLELEKKNNQLMNDMSIKEDIEGFLTEKEAPKSSLFGKNDVFSRFRHEKKKEEIKTGKPALVKNRDQNQVKNEGASRREATAEEHNKHTGPAEASPLNRRAKSIPPTLTNGLKNSNKFIEDLSQKNNQAVEASKIQRNSSRASSRIPFEEEVEINPKFSKQASNARSANLSLASQRNPKLGKIETKLAKKNAEPERPESPDFGDFNFEQHLESEANEIRSRIIDDEAALEDFENQFETAKSRPEQFMSRSKVSSKNQMTESNFSHPFDGNQSATGPKEKFGGRPDKNQFQSYPNFSETEHGGDTKRNKLGAMPVESEVELYNESGQLMDDAENDYERATDIERVKLEIMRIEEERERKERVQLPKKNQAEVEQEKQQLRKLQAERDAKEASRKELLREQMEQQQFVEKMESDSEVSTSSLGKKPEKTSVKKPKQEGAKFETEVDPFSQFNFEGFQHSTSEPVQYQNTKNQQNSVKPKKETSLSDAKVPAKKDGKKINPAQNYSVPTNTFNADGQSNFNQTKTEPQRPESEIERENKRLKSENMLLTSEKNKVTKKLEKVMGEDVRLLKEEILIGNHEITKRIVVQTQIEKEVLQQERDLYKSKYEEFFKKFKADKTEHLKTQILDPNKLLDITKQNDQLRHLNESLKVELDEEKEKTRMVDQIFAELSTTKNELTFLKTQTLTDGLFSTGKLNGRDFELPASLLNEDTRSAIVSPQIDNFEEFKKKYGSNSHASHQIDHQSRLNYDDFVQGINYENQYKSGLEKNEHAETIRLNSSGFDFLEDFNKELEEVLNHVNGIDTKPKEEYFSQIKTYDHKQYQSKQARHNQTFSDPSTLPKNLRPYNSTWVNPKKSQHQSPVQKNYSQYASQYVTPIVSQPVYAQTAYPTNMSQLRPKISDPYKNSTVQRSNFDLMAPFKFIYDEIPLPKPITQTQVRISTPVQQQIPFKISSNTNQPPSPKPHSVYRPQNSQVLATHGSNTQSAKLPKQKERKNAIQQLIKKTEDKPNIINLKACSVFDDGVVYEDMDLKISFASQISDIENGNSRGIFEVEIKAKARFKLKSVIECLHEGFFVDEHNRKQELEFTKEKRSVSQSFGLILNAQTLASLVPVRLMLLVEQSFILKKFQFYSDEYEIEIILPVTINKFLKIQNSLNPQKISAQLQSWKQLRKEQMKINKDIISSKGAITKFCEGFKAIASDFYAGVIEDRQGSYFGLSISFVDAVTMEVASYGNRPSEIIDGYFDWFEFIFSDNSGSAKS